MPDQVKRPFPWKKMMTMMMMMMMIFSHFWCLTVGTDDNYHRHLSVVPASQRAVGTGVLVSIRAETVRRRKHRKNLFKLCNRLSVLGILYRFDVQL
jgi:hypothetical protein